MDQSVDVNAGLIRLLNHHLYELSKGIRPLCMLTMPAGASARVIERLLSKGVAYYVHNACPTKVNVIFGQAAAVAVARHFLTVPLCKLTPEHDFMLGILLGYDREQQCVRYLERSAQKAQPSVLPKSELAIPSAWLDAAIEANPERAN